MKVRRAQDEDIKGKIAVALKAAVDKSPDNAEAVAAKLKISTATLYKYMNGDMIPGGQILWRVCEHLPIILDKHGLHPPQRSHGAKVLKDEAQYVLPFLNESVDGEKVNCRVRRKDNQYVQVNLRIKLAG
jgi:transcriptional regulator with XRE-family HTH domain